MKTNRIFLNDTNVIFNSVVGIEKTPTLISDTGATGITGLTGTTGETGIYYSLDMYGSMNVDGEIYKYGEVFMTISHIWLHGRFLDAAKYNDVAYTRYLVRSTCYCFFSVLITYTNYFCPGILNRLDSIVAARCFVELEWWRAERQN
jgi:hypothetical protein